MGTMIQAHGLDEAGYRGEAFRDHGQDVRGCNDLLSLTRPDIVEEIHTAYLEAGADIVETNTFTATSISLADYGLGGQAFAINKSAAEIARRATRRDDRAYAGQTSLCRRFDRPDKQDGLDLARRG